MPETGATAFHRRSLVFDAFAEGDDDIRIVGRLRDERPWARVATDLPIIHDIELAVTISRADFTVVAVAVDFHVYPHAECVDIAEAYQSLVGLRVGRGWTNALRERVGGPAGCTHLRELARAMGPVLLQAAFSARRFEEAGREPDPEVLRPLLPLLTDTCHVWAAGGVAEQKLDHGWRPGMVGYPVPRLED